MKNHRWNQACQRTRRLDPNSPFHRKRTEEKTEGGICWAKQSPKWNHLPVLFRGCPFLPVTWKKHNHYQAPAKALRLVLLKVTEPGGRCVCSSLVCRERDVADAIPGSSTPARSHWSAAQCSENSEIYYQCEHVLIDQITCFCSLCVPNCTRVRAHTHVNMHTCMRIYRRTHTGY